jgi:Flp pilus assembly protein TadG
MSKKLFAILRDCITHRLLRQEDGVAAVEFALVAVPFFALVFAIIETALVFFAGQALQTAATNAARLIFTGQAQSGSYSASTFKNAVCNSLAAMFNCTSSVYVNVQTYSNFASASIAPPMTNGQLNTNNLSFSPGGPNDVVVVQVYYLWPIYASLLDHLANQSGNNRLLVATAVFQNEPY